MSNQYNSQKSEQIAKAIDKLFYDSKINQYIKNQFHQIQQYNPKLVRINKNSIVYELSFQSSSSLYHFSNRFQNQEQEIKFLVQIQQYFPLHPPKIYLKSHLTNPNISDCRDLFQIINSGTQWNIHSHLKQCILKIPKFLQNLSKIKSSIELQKLGKFDLGAKYNYQFISQFSSGQKYYGFETEEEKVKLFIIYLTQTHFLQFQPKQQPQFVDDKLKIPKKDDISEMQLIFMADIQSITQIQLNKQKNEFILYFFTIKAKHMEFIKINIKKQLKIANSINFIERLLKFMVNLQPIQINIQKTKQNLQQSQQSQLLREVLKQQQKIQHYLNKKTIQELNDTYQQIVEFYSSNNNPYYLIYLHKISNLYERKDVKLILQVKQQNYQLKQK